jgi:hypothetical protein
MSNANGTWFKKPAISAVSSKSCGFIPCSDPSTEPGKCSPLGSNIKHYQGRYPLTKEMSHVILGHPVNKDTWRPLCVSNTTVNKKNGVWDVTPCGSCKNRRFGGT